MAINNLYIWCKSVNTAHLYDSDASTQEHCGPPEDTIADAKVFTFTPTSISSNWLFGFFHRKNSKQLLENSAAKKVLFILWDYKSTLQLQRQHYKQ